MDKISIKINGKTCLAEAGENVLTAALKNGIDIPSLCFHQDLKPSQKCGMCVIEINGKKGLKHACATTVKEGMEITTESKEIEETRKKNLDKVLENHLLECIDCVWFQNCRLLDLVKKFEAKPMAKENKQDKVLQVGTIVFDQTKCIGCGNCVAVCPTGFLELNKRDKTEPSINKKKDCINCGQCILHCPVGAIEGVGEFEELENMFKDKSKIVVAQFAPSIRSSIGEEFDMKAGMDVTRRLVSALKKVGFNYVFDTACGADFTTMEESEELVERLTSNKNLPAMTSCCPAWVEFLEFNFPEFINNLCTSRSPQIMLGGLIKNYWSKKNKIDPKNIHVVSIMPCVAKKFEIKREELKIDGMFPVDQVLTNRELARLLKKNKIDLKNVEERDADNPLGLPSGAGVIYGSSGGVFESAFRTAYFKIMKKEMPPDMIKEIRGAKGIKVTQVKVGDRTVKICVVNGIKNARTVLEKLKKNPKLYDAVEVMSCPGGCVGGGGQPMPTNKEIVAKRSQGLYSIDKKKKLRYAHKNPVIKTVYGEFLDDQKVRKKILHTRFSRRNKSKIRKLKNSRETYE